MDVVRFDGSGVGNLRDDNVAAPLKRAVCGSIAWVRDHLRDDNVAAPLKRIGLVIVGAVRLNLRDDNVAAPLKPELRRGVVPLLLISATTTSRPH